MRPILVAHAVISTTVSSEGRWMWWWTTSVAQTRYRTLGSSQTRAPLSVFTRRRFRVFGQVSQQTIFNNNTVLTTHLIPGSEGESNLIFTPTQRVVLVMVGSYLIQSLRWLSNQEPVLQLLLDRPVSWPRLVHYPRSLN